MLTRTFLALLCLAALAVVAAAESPPTAIEPQLIKVPIRATTGQPPARDDQLLPDAADLVSGNAAPFWLRAAIALQQTQYPWTEKEDNWLSPATTSLRDLPRQEVRKLLDSYQEALRLADQAALRDRCDWEAPPLTVEALVELPLVEPQACRVLARLLNLRARLELAEGHPDRALHSVRVGLALGRDVGHGPTVIHGLVGVAIAMIMLVRTEEVLQQPEMPNLYWAATRLPRPLVDLRQPLESELGMLYHSYPDLHRLEEGRLSGPQAAAILESLVSRLTWTESHAPGTPQVKRLDLKQVVAAHHKNAVGYLLAHRYKPEEVHALTDTQAVALYLLGRYSEDRRELLRWAALPPWQGREGLFRMDKRLREEAERDRGDGLGELLPLWAAKVHEAGTRLERQVAALRCVEAIRLYAAAHEGKLPAALADVTEVPLPIDPFTGKGFDGYYKRSGDTAVLDVPPPPDMPVNLGRRYELTRSP
jgi:hypothetical protein